MFTILAAADKKGWLLLMISFVFLTVSVLLGLFSGASFIPPSVLFEVLFSGSTQDPVYRIFMTVRLPRVLGALLAAVLILLIAMTSRMSQLFPDAYVGAGYFLAGAAVSFAGLIGYIVDKSK